MSLRHLGVQVDVHGGGRDLIFSHHESERAQSESLTGCVPFARAWMHTGMVRYEGRKMSKSLGNLVIVSEALERAPAAALRLYLISHRYRRDWTFSWEGLEPMRSFVERLQALLGERAPAAERPGGRLLAEFIKALAADLDTPAALRILRAAVNQRDAQAAAWMLRILAGDAALKKN
jgi:cysteinyl-tRNA synthetase